MSQGFTPTKPDYTVSAMVKSTEEKGPVGVAWRGQSGSIRIKLNSFVVLHGGNDLVLTLFDVKETERKFGGGRGQAGPPPEKLPPDEPPPY